MRRIFAIVLALVPAFVPLMGQEEAVLRAARYLSAASTDEETDASWIDRLETAGKIRINSAYLRPGILSEYQVATVKDYRSRHGDILSFEELSLVDGYSGEFVSALKPFISLESRRLPGNADTVRIQTSAILRGTLSSVGAKAKVEGADWLVGGAWRGRDLSFFADASSRFGRVVAGDMNIRFGQGLCLWSGFSMESLSTVDAFVKRSSGITPAWSWNPSLTHRGIAYEYSFRRFSASAFWSKGGFYGLHAAYLSLRGSAGLTVSNSGFSLDGRFNYRNADLAAEAALRNGSLAGVLALRLKAGEKLRLSFQARALPSRYSGKKYGEYGFAGGGQWESASLTFDAALLPIPGTDPRRLQIRVYAVWKAISSPLWGLDLRLTERYRNYEAPRTSIRADLTHTSGNWLGAFRCEAVRCGDWGILSYIEAGNKGEAHSAYIRLTGFSTASWNSRIYCYERDAAGTFSVPAYSGKGLSLSGVGGIKKRWKHFTLKCNLRAAVLFRTEHKPGYTLNLQITSSLP